jgi:hypothetical protein
VSDGERLALTRLWWSWNTPVIRKAVEAALQAHWVPLVDRACKANGHAGWVPADWQQLRALRRDRGTLQKVIRGQSAGTHPFLLGLAALLRLDVQAFFPTTRVWVAGAARYLCADPIVEADSLTYADFLLAEPPRDRAHTQAELDARLAAVPPETRAAILRVASELGPILHTADRSVADQGEES